MEQAKYGHRSDISLSSTYIETRLKQLSSCLYISYQTFNMVNIKHPSMQTRHAAVYSKLVKDQWLYILDVYQSSCPQADYNVQCPLYFTKRNITNRCSNVLPNHSSVVNPAKTRYIALINAATMSILEMEKREICEIILMLFFCG